MGIDNELRLFFGIVLEHEDAAKIASFYNTTIEKMFWDEDICNFMDDWPDLIIAYASSYYDSAIEDVVIFLAIDEWSYGEFDNETVKKFVNEWESTSFRKCLEKFNIPFAEPKMTALVHIC